jgi:hypothetical protein
MGYANLLSEGSRLEEGFKEYDTVIELKPDFINAYVCKALLYQFKRNIPIKAIENAI